MRALVALALLASLTGCPPPVAAPRTLGIEDLRRLAERRPDDPRAQRELAVAELLGRGGDAARAGDQIARARRLAEDDVELRLLSALEAHLHGRPDDALAGFLDTLDACRRSRQPSAPFVAEVAATAIEELFDLAPAFADTVRPRLEEIVEGPGRIGAAARQTASEVLIELAYRRGDAGATRELAEDQGCLVEWRVAGPFGPRDLLGFDREHPARAAGPLADEYELDATRGTRPTRAVEANGCAVHLGDGPVPGGGSTFAETFVDVPRAGEYVLRLETPNAARLLVDGEEVVVEDMRREPSARTSFHVVELDAGRREITVEVATRHPNPILLVSLMQPNGRPLGAEARTGRAFDPDLPDIDGALGAYLRATVAMARGDTVEARETLRRHAEGADAASAMLQLRALVALNDPLLPPDMRRDEARRLLRAAAARDELAFYPPLSLATLAAAEGRDVAAIGELRQGRERWPEVVLFPLTLSELLLGRGWDAEGAREIERARHITPDGCRPLQAALGVARSRDRMDDVSELVEQVLSCDARRSDRFALLVQQRRWADAERELDRLLELTSEQSRHRFLHARVQLANGRADDALLEDTLSRLAQANPRSVGTRIMQVDRLLAADRVADARQLIDAALTEEPADMTSLRRLRHVIGGVDELAPYRVDGAAALAAFQASGRRYDEPQVLVLDYTVTRVFDDGSAVELTHNIFALQSEEAVDEHGEFSLPDGARLLRLHTIKADGTRLEPDEIEGKETISMPNLAPGDFVEFEYVRTIEPPQGFPGGVIGDRFYFRSFEVPFDRSQLTVVLPAGMAVVVDPRGPAPETRSRIEGGVRILEWRVDESRPLTQEPSSVAPREYLPSINWGVRATWASFVESLVDILADRDVFDPEARRLALRILDRDRDGSDLRRARRLYRWVLRNVENNSDVFGLAPAMLAQRTGNRARVLHYMLGLVGIPSRLVMARDASGDSTRSELADDDTYQHLLVMLEPRLRGEPSPRIFLSTAQRGAPFGYVPPLVRGQRAMILEEDGAVVTIPAGQPDADRHRIEIDAHLSTGGAARVEVVETFRGAPAIGWRNDLEGVPAAELDAQFEQHYVARLVPSATLSSLAVEGRDTPERPLVLRYVFEVPAFGRRQGERWLLPTLFPSNLAATFAQAGSRTTTQVVAPPMDIAMRLRVHVPEGTPDPALPAAVELEAPGGGRFRTRSRMRDGAIVLDRFVRIPVARVTAEEYPALADFCRRAGEAEEREVGLRLPD